MEDIKVPDITADLLEALEALAPNALPTFSSAVPAERVALELAYLQGQQSIINRLRFEYDKYTRGDWQG